MEFYENVNLLKRVFSCSVKIKETAVFTKRAAQDMASDNAKRARLEHELKSQECYSKKHCH